MQKRREFSFEMKINFTDPAPPLAGPAHAWSLSNIEACGRCSRTGPGPCRTPCFAFDDFSCTVLGDRDDQICC